MGDARARPPEGVGPGQPHLCHGRRRIAQPGGRAGDRADRCGGELVSARSLARGAKTRAALVYGLRHHPRLHDPHHLRLERDRAAQSRCSAPLPPGLVRNHRFHAREPGRDRAGLARAHALLDCGRGETIRPGDANVLRRRPLRSGRARHHRALLRRPASHRQGAQPRKILHRAVSRRPLSDSTRNVATKLPLSLTCGDYEITRPLAEGLVEPDGIALTVLTNTASRDRHWRLERNAECDLGEFNVCAYFMARDRGHPYIALPIYPHRRFRHGFVFINTGKGIARPADLRGRRIGCYGGFQPAANVWLRGILDELFGLPVREALWVVPAVGEIPFTPPPGLTIETIPESKSLDDMLAEGEIDAMLAPSFPAPFIRGDKRVARLFPDYKTLEIDYYRRTGIFPIMQAVIIRRDIL